MDEMDGNVLVMKFGGASLRAPENFSNIVEIILKRALIFKKIVVVVSAMGKTTDELLALAKKVHPSPPKREQDMLVSVGERISMALLAMALALKDKEAISFTGSQSGIVTSDTHSDAYIIDVKPHRILKELDHGKIVIVAGFQGVSRKGEITTLGRGGSDTSAVALGVALHAKQVEFYKDVSGIFSEDPKIFPDSQLFPHLSFEEVLAITQKGAKILHPRSVLLAKKNHLPLHVLSFEETFAKGTVIDCQTATRDLVPVYEEEK